MTVETLIPVAYLIAAITFILGLKGLSSPTTAVQGNRIAAGGMLIAVIATFFAADVKGGVPIILAGIAVGGVAGFDLADDQFVRGAGAFHPLGGRFDR